MTDKDFLELVNKDDQPLVTPLRHLE